LALGTALPPKRETILTPLNATYKGFGMNHLKHVADHIQFDAALEWPQTPPETAIGTNTSFLSQPAL
jgi:hypothetical protein